KPSGSSGNQSLPERFIPQSNKSKRYHNYEAYDSNLTGSWSAPETAPPQSAIVASFDCSKASSKIEHLICSSPQTADADRQLTAAYRTAALKPTDQMTLKQDQRDWIKVRNACDDAACLLNVTATRIQTLSAM
ncbi:lysozyme inhibitor LprI family protein, partial [Caballeronia sp. M23-90]